MSQHTKPAFSIPAILAVIAAIASFFQGATFGLLLAIAAIILGVLGILLSLAVRKRGGVVSLFSVFAGVLGILAAVIKAMLYLFG